MKDLYHIDFKKYSLYEFQNSLRKREMIPSRVSLKIELNKRFKILEKNDISNLSDLVEALKTKQKIERFSKKTKLTEEYLTLLNREAKSYLPNPVRLDKLPGIAPNYIKGLNVIGIFNTRHIVNETKTKKQRERISKITEIPIEKIYELVGLSDLCRVYGVGPVFSRMIYDMGIQSIKKFVEHTASEFIEIYEEKTQKKADFGINDIQFSLELAKELEQLVEN